MRRLAVYLFLILLVLVSSGSLVAYGFYEFRTAQATELFAAFDFKSADNIYQDLEKNLDYGQRIPTLLDKWKSELKISRARVKYWEKNYSELVDYADNGQDRDSEDPNLRFIRANASYKNVEKEKNKKNFIEGIESAISGYIYTIRNDSENLNAAFNYEYLLRVRSDTTKNKKPNGEPSNPIQGIHGQKGQQVQRGDEGKIRVHIPLTDEEADKLKGEKDAGKGDFKRKGG
ncbi:MAG: hypothetical protein Q7S43_00115 [bacterium]|nr:hypothetical protein [bacterium]